VHETVIARKLATRRPERTTGPLLDRRLEHFQEKACPGLDHKRVHARLPTRYGWKPVFRPKMRSSKKSWSMFSFH
jgi:hypothetical protein